MHTPHTHTDMGGEILVGGRNALPTVSPAIVAPCTFVSSDPSPFPFSLCDCECVVCSVVSLSVADRGLS